MPRQIALRIVAAYQVLMALAVGVHFIITPLYHPGGDEPFTAWLVLNWFMAVSAVIVLIGSYARKRRMDAEEADARTSLEVNVVFYAALGLFLWFFWNWFGALTDQGNGTLWAFIDPLFVLVVGPAGLRMWRAIGG
ncbi:MAG: hypothetical protein OXG79_03420 [Chloroflexi bacterium]|nr:hypothetical protein [Chloroflexota bacterium]MCY4111135.1 hypothetical protein [Chloroflexota bacterium]